MEESLMREKWHRLVWVSVLAWAALLLAGCASLPAANDDGTDPLPWNAPAGWENTIIGVPF